MQSATSAAQILSLPDRVKVEPVEVPEWGLVVHVRMIGAGERDKFEASLHDGKGKLQLAHMRARAVVLFACTADGKPLFSDADLLQLTNKSAAALDRIFDAGSRLNRMSKSDLDDARKNFESDQTADSSSGSRSPSVAQSES